MKVVIQRVSRASVRVENTEIASIGRGLVLLVGIHKDDTSEDIVAFARKVVRMRIFSDENGRMNTSVRDIDGSLLVISQYTLIADTENGNRPSFINAARPEKARQLYELLLSELHNQKVNCIEKGAFGEYMQVEMVNDGPVTVVL